MDSKESCEISKSSENVVSEEKKNAKNTTDEQKTELESPILSFWDFSTGEVLSLRGLAYCMMESLSSINENMLEREEGELSNDDDDESNGIQDRSITSDSQLVCKRHREKRRNAKSKPILRNYRHQCENADRYIYFSRAQRLRNRNNFWRYHWQKLPERNTGTFSGQPKILSSQERRISGPKPAASSQEERISGPKPAASSLDRRISGPKPAASSQERRISGPRPAASSQEKRISGPKPAASSQEKRISGPKPAASSQERRISGPRPADSSQEKRLSGPKLAASSQERRIAGPRPADSSQERRISGPKLAASSQERRIAGPKLAASSQEKRISGPKPAASSQEKRISGPKPAASSQERRISGPKLAASSQERRISGPKLTASSQERRISGLKLAASSQERRISGPKLAASSQERRISGPKLAASSQERRISGPKLTASSQERRISAPKLAASSQERRISAPKPAASSQERRISDPKRAAFSQKREFGSRKKAHSSQKVAISSQIFKQRNLKSNTDTQDELRRLEQEHEHIKQLLKMLDEEEKQIREQEDSENQPSGYDSLLDVMEILNNLDEGTEDGKENMSVPNACKQPSFLNQVEEGRSCKLPQQLSEIMVGLLTSQSEMSCSVVTPSGKYTVAGNLHQDELSVVPSDLSKQTTSCKVLNEWTARGNIQSAFSLSSDNERTASFIDPPTQIPVHYGSRKENKSGNRLPVRGKSVVNNHSVSTKYDAGISRRSTTKRRQTYGTYKRCSDNASFCQPVPKKMKMALPAVIKVLQTVAEVVSIPGNACSTYDSDEEDIESLRVKLLEDVQEKRKTVVESPENEVAPVHERADLESSEASRVFDEGCELSVGQQDIVRLSPSVLSVSQVDRSEDVCPDPSQLLNDHQEEQSPTELCEMKITTEESSSKPQIQLMLQPLTRSPSTSVSTVNLLMHLNTASTTAEKPPRTIQEEIPQITVHESPVVSHEMVDRCMQMEKQRSTSSSKPQAAEVDTKCLTTSSISSQKDNDESSCSPDGCKDRSLIELVALSSTTECLIEADLEEYCTKQPQIVDNNVPFSQVSSESSDTDDIINKASLLSPNVQETHLTLPLILSQFKFQMESLESCPSKRTIEMLEFPTNESCVLDAAVMTPSSVSQCRQTDTFSITQEQTLLTESAVELSSFELLAQLSQVVGATHQYPAGSIEYQSQTWSTTQIPPVKLTVQLSPVESTAQLSPLESTAQLSPVESTAQLSLFESTARLSPVESTAQLSPVESTAQLSLFESPARLNSVESTTQLSPVESTARLNSVESTTQLSPVQSTARLNSVESTAQLSPVESTAQLSPVESTAQLSLFESTAQLSPVESTARLNSVESTTQLNSAESTAQLNQIETTAQLTLVESTAHISPAESTVQHPTVESTAHISPAESTVQHPTAESTAQLSMDETTAQLPTSKSKAQISPVESTTQLPTVEATAQIFPTESTSQISRTECTAQPKAQTSPVESKTQLSPGEFTAWLNIVKSTAQLSTFENPAQLSPVESATQLNPVEFRALVNPDESAAQLSTAKPVAPPSTADCTAQMPLSRSTAQLFSASHSTPDLTMCHSSNNYPSNAAHSSHLHMSSLPDRSRKYRQPIMLPIHPPVLVPLSPSSDSDDSNDDDDQRKTQTQGVPDPTNAHRTLDQNTGQPDDEVESIKLRCKEQELIFLEQAMQTNQAKVQVLIGKKADILKVLHAKKEELKQLYSQLITFKNEITNRQSCVNLYKAKIETTQKEIHLMGKGKEQCQAHKIRSELSESAADMATSLTPSALQSHVSRTDGNQSLSRAEQRAQEKQKLMERLKKSTETLQKLKEEAIKKDTRKLSTLVSKRIRNTENKRKLLKINSSAKMQTQQQLQNGKKCP